MADVKVHIAEFDDCRYSICGLKREPTRNLSEWVQDAEFAMLHPKADIPKELCRECLEMLTTLLGNLVWVAK